MLARLELLLQQIAAVKAERDAWLAAQPAGSPLLMLLALRAIGAQAAHQLWVECLCRCFVNRRKVAAFGGLAATPWRSGAIQREQGLTQAGNPRVRKLMIQRAWLWLRYQPGSALSRWFRHKVKGQSPRLRRIAIVALARKLLVALWHYLRDGVIPKGATLKPAA
jgi:transposase